MDFFLYSTKRWSYGTKKALKNHSPVDELVEYADSISAEVYDPLSNECLGYVTKLSDSEALVLELWGIKVTPSAPLLPGPLWPDVVVPVRISYMDQIELFNHLQYLKSLNYVQTILLVLDSGIYPPSHQPDECGTRPF